jgi:hypothetical protein
LVKLVQPLFAEHAFLTVICAILVVMMTLSFYRFLKGISPGLVAFIFLLMFGILILHWTFTRTEPAFLKPAIDYIAPFFPTAPQYPDKDKEKPKSAPSPPSPPNRPRYSGFGSGTGFPACAGANTPRRQLRPVAGSESH